jgi:hypothetical protein
VTARGARVTRRVTRARSSRAGQEAEFHRAHDGRLDGVRLGVIQRRRPTHACAGRLGGHEGRSGEARAYVADLLRDHPAGRVAEDDPESPGGDGLRFRVDPERREPAGTCNRDDPCRSGRNVMGKQDTSGQPEPDGMGKKDSPGRPRWDVARNHDDSGRRERDVRLPRPTGTRRAVKTGGFTGRERRGGGLWILQPETAETVLERSDIEGHEKADGEAGQPQVR